MQTMESFENPSKLSILRGRGIRSIIVGHASRSSSSDTLFQITSPLTEKRSPSRITDRSSGNSRRLSRYVLCLDFRNENGVTARDSNGAVQLRFRYIQDVSIIFDRKVINVQNSIRKKDKYEVYTRSMWIRFCKIR